MLPENDRWSETRSQLLAQMDVSMGGRVAEEMMFGQEYITTGQRQFLSGHEGPRKYKGEERLLFVTGNA